MQTPPPARFGVVHKLCGLGFDSDRLIAAWTHPSTFVSRFRLGSDKLRFAAQMCLAT